MDNRGTFVGVQPIPWSGTVKRSAAAFAISLQALMLVVWCVPVYGHVTRACVGLHLIPRSGTADMHAAAAFALYLRNIMLM